MSDILSFNKKTGWLDGVIQKPSPNFNQRPNKDDISLLVIHCISLPKGQYGGNEVIDFFQNNLDFSKDNSLIELKDIKVSSHFFIRRTGEIIQFVSVYDRAWHAGISAYKGRANCNDYSIGIELEGTDDTHYEPVQYQSLVILTKFLIKNTIINKDRITAHSKIAPNRKTDPGHFFDWGHYLGLL